jgi:hypothetical protein
MQVSRGCPAVIPVMPSDSRGRGGIYVPNHYFFFVSDFMVVFADMVMAELQKSAVEVEVSKVPTAVTAGEDSQGCARDHDKMVGGKSRQLKVLPSHEAPRETTKKDQVSR